MAVYSIIIDVCVLTNGRQPERSLGAYIFVHRDMHPYKNYLFCICLLTMRINSEKAEKWVHKETPTHILHTMFEEGNFKFKKNGPTGLTGHLKKVIINALWYSCGQTLIVMVFCWAFQLVAEPSSSDSLPLSPNCSWLHDVSEEGISWRKVLHNDGGGFALLLLVYSCNL